MPTPKKRRKLTRKQLMFFGTKRQRAAAHVRSSKVHRQANAILKRKSRSTTAKRKTTKRKSTKRPSWVTPVILAAVTAAAIAGGLTLNKFVQSKGGWSKLKVAYVAGSAGSGGIVGGLLGAANLLMSPAAPGSAGTPGSNSPAPLTSTSMQQLLATTSQGFIGPPLISQPQPFVGSINQALVDQVAQLQAESDAAFALKAPSSTFAQDGSRLSVVDYGSPAAAQAALAAYMSNFV